MSAEILLYILLKYDILLASSVRRVERRRIDCFLEAQLFQPRLRSARQEQRHAIMLACLERVAPDSPDLMG